MDKKLHAGFTLIETVIVMGIVALCASILPFVDLSTYRHDALSDERMRLVALLSHARAQAMNNVHQRAHGVALASDGYVLFTGERFADADHTHDEKVLSPYPIVFSTSSPYEIVFAQLSGDTNYDGTIEMSSPTPGTSVRITINHEGSIGW